MVYLIAFSANFDLELNTQSYWKDAYMYITCIRVYKMYTFSFILYLPFSLSKLFSTKTAIYKNCVKLNKMFFCFPNAIILVLFNGGKLSLVDRYCLIFD